jgi:phosphatidylinositol 4-kinase B
MQATLQDLSHDPTAPSFTICQRILHKCHEIVFGDLPAPMSGPYASLGVTAAPQPRLPRRKIKPNMEPALVGIGMMLAGVPAWPSLTAVVGEVAIEQGRIDTGGVERSLEGVEDDLAVSPIGVSPTFTGNKTEQVSLNGRNSTPTLPRRSTIIAAQTSPALALHLHDMKRSRMSEDPLGQNDSEQATTPYQSSPMLASMPNRPSQRNVLSMADVLLRSYDPCSQMNMLQSHYCRSEASFNYMRI